MKLLKKILVSIDFGNQSERILKQSVALANAFSTQVDLLHVVPLGFFRQCGSEEIILSAKKELEAYMHRLEGQGVVVGEMMVNCGDPFTEIIDQAEKLHSNMIVMGEKDYEPDGNIELGVTAWRVVRKSEKPVWVVKARAMVPGGDILCAIDFSDASGRALKSAIILARTFKCKLHVLHVADDSNMLSGHYEPLAKNKLKNSTVAQENRFNLFLEQYDFHQTDWEKHEIKGDPGTAIAHAAGLFKVDTIMLGSVGGSNSDKLLMGAVAEKVIKSVPQHIVSFKNEHAIKMEIINNLETVKDYLMQGKNLLENGMADEAILFFKHALRDDRLLIPAWEGLAEAYHRIGQKDQAQKALDNITQIKKVFWEKKVEFELKNAFWRK